MRGIRLALPMVLAVVALTAIGCGGDDGEGSATTETTATDTTTTETSGTGIATLMGTVGSTDDPDAYEISLITEDGAEVTQETTTLTPGEYMLEINDLSSIHNFHLSGQLGGVDVATSVTGTGEKTATVAFQGEGSYTYLCDAHPDTMTVNFIVGAG